MPKSSKKRKEKAADFSKAKLKLGKGKQTPNNAVDTSFKARSIALPSQGIVHDADRGVPTTRRKLTNEDLISQLKHYNANVRKDAIVGLRELFEDYPDIVISSLSTTLNNCARMIADDDANVRKSLLTFLGWLLPRVPRDALLPHTSILLLFTTSAQTHIFPEIRIDAIRFVDLFLEFFPDVVVEGWMDGHAGHGPRILEGYLGVLSAGTAYGEAGDTGPVQATSTASVILSPASKLVVLRSFSSFLSQAISSRDLNCYNVSQEETPKQLRRTPAWFMGSAFTSKSAFEAFDTSVLPAFSWPTSVPARQWQEESFPEDGQEDFVGSFPLLASDSVESWSFDSLSNLESIPALDGSDSAGSSSGIRAESAYVSHLARTLQPTLVSTFLDCAPSAFAPGSTPSETELQMVLAVGKLARCLYGVVPLEASEARYSVYDGLATLLGHMSPYFPFVVRSSPLARRDVKIEQSLQDLNLVFCELTSTLILRSDDSTNLVRRAATNSKQPPRQLNSFTQRVSEYSVQLLRGEAPERADAQTLGPRSITPTTYVSLLPTVWALINTPGAEFAENVVQACVEHAVKAASMSAVKRHTVDFIGRLLLLDTAIEYRGQFHIKRYAVLEQKFTQWLLHLPKTLWELGSSNLPATETILRVLLRLAQRRSFILNAETLSQMRARLVPFFKISHPSRGELPGPFTKLPASPVRTLVLDLAATLGAAGGEGDLENAVEGAVRSEESQYWTAVRS